MDNSEHDIDADEQQRELVRQATGVLIARYGLDSGEAERVLMDWSRTTGVAVFELAEWLVDSAQHGTPDRQGAYDLLRGASTRAQPDFPVDRAAGGAAGGVENDLWERVLVLHVRVREIGLGLADTADRVARTYDALADGREKRGTRNGDQQALERARVTRERACAERDEAEHLRRTYGAPSSR